MQPNSKICNQITSFLLEKLFPANQNMEEVVIVDVSSDELSECNQAKELKHRK